MVCLGLWARLRVAATGRDVDLAAKDGLQAAIAGVIVKDDRRKEIAVFGDGQRWHVQLDGLIEQLVYTTGAVKQ